MKLFKKILIANRGEIAVRIIKSAQKLGIMSVAIYSEIDAESLHVGLANEAYCIGKEELSDTYLNVAKIIRAATESGCDALHPGYGFLAESPLLVEACEKAHITFIGPRLKAIQLMGNKIKARAFVKKLGVPMTEGITGSPSALFKKAHSLTFPILVKAAAGGGGKGMRIVHEGDDLKEILEATAREAKNYFGDGTIYIEKYIEEPRHIEFQILGDNFGKVVHLFERECTIQRRYQKIIEESPSPTLTPQVREAMAKSALAIAEAVEYNSAGTIEFLVDNELNYYFLEMNTRIQVEHPVTEMVTGIDLVDEQMLVAAGNPLRLNQDNLSQNGHAIECRIYAEDPANNFMPSPGKMTFYKQPEGSGIRVDTSIEKAGTIQSIFDPMISKMIVWGEDRPQAIEKCKVALKSYSIQGIKTNIPYLLHLLNHPAFEQNSISTKFCDEHTDEIIQSIQNSRENLGNLTAALALALYQLNAQTNSTPKNIWEHIGYWRNVMELQFLLDEENIKLYFLKKQGQDFIFEIDGQKKEVYLQKMHGAEMDFRIFNRSYKTVISQGEKGRWFVNINGNDFELKRLDTLTADEDYTMGNDGNSEGSLFAPMPGKVIKVNVNAGDKVARGSILLVVEAMKMENNIIALENSLVEKVNVKEGDRVDTDLQLVNLVPQES